MLYVFLEFFWRHYFHGVKAKIDSFYSEHALNYHDRDTPYLYLLCLLTQHYSHGCLQRSTKEWQSCSMGASNSHALHILPGKIFLMNNMNGIVIRCTSIYFTINSFSMHVLKLFYVFPFIIILVKKNFNTCVYKKSK